MKSSLGHKGYIQVYYGDGKGKTTAAIGQLVRLLGHGGRGVLVQFFKDQFSGEIGYLEKDDKVTILRGKAGAGFTFTMTDEEKRKTKEIHTENLKKAWALVKQGGIDLLVLDEGVDAYASDFVDIALLEQVLLEKPGALDIVLTGHSLPDFFQEQGDYITHMKKVKHPFDLGVKERKGIEY